MMGLGWCMCQMVLCEVFSCQGGAEVAVVFLVWAAYHVLYIVR